MHLYWLWKIIMNKERIFYTEAAYVCGIVLLAFSAAFMEAADFGVSMVVAPAYLIYLKVSKTLSFFTFGMAEYLFQAFLLILLVLVLHRFRLSYLFSFFTAVFYGMVLDIAMKLVDFIPLEAFGARLALYVTGALCCSFSVSLLFHTYLSPEVYELFVKEISAKFRLNINHVKTCYDCISCAVGILMSFLFFGWFHFEGVKAGTILCALVNGWLIGRFSVLLESHFSFRDRLPLRKYFSG